jgi:hypothetical protein
MTTPIKIAADSLQSATNNSNKAEARLNDYMDQHPDDFSSDKYKGLVASCTRCASALQGAQINYDNVLKINMEVIRQRTNSPDISQPIRSFLMLVLERIQTLKINDLKSTENPHKPLISPWKQRRMKFQKDSNASPYIDKVVPSEAPQSKAPSAKQRPQEAPVIPSTNRPISRPAPVHFDDSIFVNTMVKQPTHDISPSSILKSNRKESADSLSSQKSVTGNDTKDIKPSTPFSPASLIKNPRNSLQFYPKEVVNTGLRQHSVILISQWY